MSTSSESMSLMPSSAGARILSSSCSESLECITLVSSLAMPSTCSTADIARVVSLAAFFIGGFSASSLTAIASARPGAISTIECSWP